MPNKLKIVDVNSLPEGLVLQHKAATVDAKRIRLPVIQDLIDDMMLTYKAAGLVGLAAPQVSKLERIIIVSSEPRPWYPNDPVIEPVAMLNPVILEHSEEKVIGWEGCGSLKTDRGYPRAEVERSLRVLVSFHDRHGEGQRMRCEGLLARVVQHEVDHLEGIMFTERIISGGRLYEEDEFKKLMAEEEKQ